MSHFLLSLPGRWAIFAEDRSAPIMTKYRNLACLLSLCAGGGDLGGQVPGVADGGASDADPGADAFVLECDPPDFMMVLDRTGSMSQRPDGTMPPNTSAGADQTKWSIAVNAIEAMSAARDTTLRFGLALFPLDPNGANDTDCSNLDTWLQQYLPPQSNDPVCLPAEILVSPVLGAGALIDAAIARDTTGLCSYTPIGAGLTAARDGLLAIRQAGRDQYALLITDGEDTCDQREGYLTNSLESADSLRAEGVKTFVVGFDGSGDGIDAGHLNDLACAGGTAPGFDDNCLPVGANYRAVLNPAPAELFLLANDESSLAQALNSITSEVCCGCID